MEKAILLVVQTNTYFSSLISLARLLKKSQQFEPIIFFSRDYPTKKNDLKICQRENIPYLTSQHPESEKHFCLQGVIRLIPGLSIWLSIVQEIVKVKKRLLYIRKIISTVQPSLIVFAGNNIWYDDKFFIKVGKTYNIPSIIIPSWMAGPKEPAEAVYTNPEYSCENWFNRQIGKLFPKWIYKYKNKNLLRLPGTEALATELLKLAPPKPWILHSGFSDVIAVESKAMRQYCIHEGLPSRKLLVTGSLPHDEMANILANRKQYKQLLCKKLQIEASIPIILTALPPNMLYGQGRPWCEFRLYDELVRFWFTTLSEVKTHQVVVSLHPSVDYKEMEYIKDYGVTIAKDRIEKFMPLCDVFVACVSSTIQWAIACGKPVINYDVYKYNYPDYLGVEAVIRVDTKKAYQKAIKRVTVEKQYYQELAKKQEQVRRDWGELDGKAGKRLLELFDQLTKH